MMNATGNLNLAFLRSGAQFVEPAACDAQPTTPGTPRGVRAKGFHDAMLSAVEKRRRETPPPALNVAFLRSGRQFVEPADGAAPAASGASRDARLEAFRRRTQAAAAEAVRAENVRRERAAVVPLNMNFLRSGLQFRAPPATTTVEARPGPSRPRDVRTKAFAEEMMRAAASSG